MPDAGLLGGFSTWFMNLPWITIYLVIGMIGTLGLVLLVFFLWNNDVWQAKFKNLFTPQKRFGIMRIVGRGGAIRRHVINFNESSHTLGEETFVLPNEQKYILLENSLPTVTFSFKDATRAIEYDPGSSNTFICPECNKVTLYPMEKARQPTNLTSIFMLQKARAAAAEFLKQINKMNLFLLIAAIGAIVSVALLLLLVNNLNGVMSTLSNMPVTIR